MTPKKHPWDQRKGESGEAYNRFLIYRNLGPARTLDAAYRLFAGAEDGGKRQAPGCWWEEYREREWRERATAWDLHNLKEHGRDAALAFVAAIRDVAMRALESLATDMRPASWDELLETMRVLNTLVGPDAIAALTDHGEPRPRPRFAGKVG